MRPAGWVDGLVDLCLPAGCVACGDWMPAGRLRALTCALCRTRLRRAPWPRCPRCHAPTGTGRLPAPDCRECRGWAPELERARFAYVLATPADRLVHALKYGGWAELAPEMGAPMAALAGGLEQEIELVVPVPTSGRRLRERGYNQAELLSRAVAARGGLDHALALERRGAGPTQVSLRPSERAENVRDAFALRRGAATALRGRRVLLVDDVLTTGATASAAAAALVRGGARNVTLVTYARALPEQGGRGR